MKVNGRDYVMMNSMIYIAYILMLPVPVATRSKARTVFGRLNT
jgi:hypothetical protein